VCVKTSHKLLGHLVTSIGIIATLVAIGCGTQSAHSNQLNAFDGAAYDALTLTQGALESMRVPIASTYPRYTSAFNDANKAYWTAVTAYRAWRSSTANSQGDVATSLGNLAAAVVNLEAAIESDFEAAPMITAKMRSQAEEFQAKANVALTVPDVLAMLKVAAAVAQSVEPTETNAPLAEIIINGTQSAIERVTAIANQSIDTTTLAPVAPIV
jgi:hypothetical protein